MKPQRVLGIIMAGGKGERLLPLTEVRSKPAVPFGGKYRIIDFVLSNFVNSDITSLYVLVQYRSQSLIEHLRKSWQIVGRLPHSFVSVVPPQMRAREGWYEGTADAVYQNLNLIDDWQPDVIAVFGADHVYRMDIRQMLEDHLEPRCGRDGGGVTGPGRGRERLRDSGGGHTGKDDRVRGKAIRAQADARSPWLRPVLHGQLPFQD